MSDNLEPGDLAIVLRSYSNKAVGKIVTCISMDGIHDEFGPMWLVEADRPMPVVGGDVVRRAHLPQSWLKKIPKDPLPDEEDEVSVDKLLEVQT